MIVLDGMPGAGKTTLLGGALADRVVFPEAQPPPGADEAGAIAWLLAEDRARTAATTPAASDRCHLGVLAYRHARAATGHGTWAQFHHALQLCRALRLDQHHADDEVLILHLDPAESLRRRAGNDDGTVWFDPAFLGAYAEFWHRLDHWVLPGARWRHLDAAHPDTTEQITALLTPATPPELLAGHLTCTTPQRCGPPRSPLVRTPAGTAVQLHSSALHHHTPGGPVRCLRTAADIQHHHLAEGEGARR